MGNEITKFVSQHYLRYDVFENMVQKISDQASLSPALIRKYTKRALNIWESKEKRDVLTLFTANPEVRLHEISKITEIIRNYFRPIIFSTKRINKSLDIITESLENMYHIY